MKEGIRWCPHCREPHRLGGRFCPNTGLPFEKELHEAARVSLPPLHPLAGTVVDGVYEVKHRIGSGGMNEVFEARDRRSGEIVALKMVKNGNPDAVARLRREAVLLEAVRHPNICAARAVGELANGQPYLVFERLEGETLETTLHGSRRLSCESAVDLFKQALRGLACAHERGIIHRDVKPSNIFLVDRGRRGTLVKLLDFGLAFDAVRPRARMTRTGHAAGTPRYMAPEQLIGSPLTAAVDLFALSTVVYQSLTGTHPFDAPTVKETAGKILYDREPDLAKLRAELPFGLTAIIHAGLAKRPSERPPSAIAMLHSLDRIAALDVEPQSSDLHDSETAPLVRF